MPTATPDLGQILGQTEVGGAPWWFGAFIGLLTLYLTGQYVAPRLRGRRDRATVRQAEAEATSGEVAAIKVTKELVDEMAQQLEADFRRRNEEMGRQLATMRDEVRAATADSAQSKAEMAAAQSKLAATQAELAALVASASQERHRLANEALEEKARRVILEREVVELRRELQAVRAQLDPASHGRRSGERRTDQ